MIYILSLSVVMNIWMVVCFVSLRKRYRGLRCVADRAVDELNFMAHRWKTLHEEIEKKLVRSV